MIEACESGKTARILPHGDGVHQWNRLPGL